MLYSETESTIERRIDQAIRKAKETGRSVCVCSIEDGGEFGERSIVLYYEKDLDGEFEAFDGRVLYEVSPSGDVY